MPSNTLPLIIISAKDSEQAKLLATELINNKDDGAEVNGSAQENFTWRLQNKYYSANVRILPVGDGDTVENDVLSLAEAHIIYIAKEEKDLAELAQKRAANVNNAEVEVYLLLYEGSKTPSVLATWACNNHYEVIPLKETASSHSDDEEDDPEGPFKETYGIERARDTLHAHTWTGLERIDIPSQLQSLDGLTLSSEDEYIGREDEEEDLNEEQMVERAEAFAMALETVLHAQASRGEGDDEMRRRRAEEAVNALRRALGPDFDWL
ncbi:uncharacterized protein LOC121727948 [Aricia agestis]|uniref:uncharacterized protein LOC121727948 n=1 Tax=Aricia agestis TaxID=91739 RepID=UPI001C206BC7|nr:uncharacterized protein LOC121727948 [Aricia agestis]